MRVAFFTESLPPNTDGVVKTLTKLIGTMQEQNVDFHFFSPVKPDESYEWTQHVTKVKSVPFFLYTYYQMGLPFFEGISKQLDRFQPDIIHLCAPTLLNIYGLNYAHRKSLPVVTSYHTHFVHYFSYFGLDWLETTAWAYLQWFHNKCDMTYAPSQSAVNGLLNQGIKDVDLWQRGIELDHFAPEMRDEKLRESIGAEDKPVLLFVGRLINHKDLDVLAAADKILKARGHDYKLVLLGDGPMRPDLEEMLPDAHMPGFVHGEELARWYASADIFVFPSSTETFGNVILESFASGVPAVGVAAGGVGDIINHERDGLIAKPHDAEDFAAQLERLLVDTDFAKGMGGRARLTAQNYSWQKINSRLLDDYREFIARSNIGQLKPALAA